MFKVEYKGFFQPVTREFETRERAEQWLRQVGKFNEATIVDLSEPFAHWRPHGGWPTKTNTR